MRTAAAALVLALAPPVAIAQNANPPPYLVGNEDGLFPQRQDRWHYEVRAPGGRGQQRFTRIEARPDGKAGWAVKVTCGLVSTRNGRETVALAGDGQAGRGRMPIIGMTFSASGTTLGGQIEQGPKDVGRLDLASTFPDSRCASGRGDLSSGD